jgi:hypothetical protein
MVLFPYWFRLARRCAGLFQIRWACSTLGTMFRTGWAYKLVKILVSFRCGTILYEEPNVFFVRLFRCSADLFPCAWFCSLTDFRPFPLFFCSAWFVPLRIVLFLADYRPFSSFDCSAWFVSFCMILFLCRFTKIWEQKLKNWELKYFQEQKLKNLETKITRIRE